MFLIFENEWLKATIMQHDEREPNVFVEWKRPIREAVTVEAYGWRNYHGTPQLTMIASLPKELQAVLSWLRPRRLHSTAEESLLNLQVRLTFAGNKRLRTDERRMRDLLDIPSEQYAGRVDGMAERLARDVEGVFAFQSQAFIEWAKRAFVEGTWASEASDTVLQQLKQDAEVAQKLADVARERARLAHKQVREHRAELIRGGAKTLPLPAAVSDALNTKLDEYTKGSHDHIFC